jgi:hypothetical protein
MGKVIVSPHHLFPYHVFRVKFQQALRALGTNCELQIAAHGFLCGQSPIGIHYNPIVLVYYWIDRPFWGESSVSRFSCLRVHKKIKH